MKNLKKTIIVFGAVVIALLMVSNTNALIITQSQQNQNSGNDLDNHVEPGIYINEKQKLFLRIAINTVNDPNVRLLLQQIIKQKGPVDSDDIEQIISDNNLELGTITSGSIKTGDDNSSICGGGFFIPRRPLYIFGMILPCCFRWKAFVDSMSNPVKIAINGEYIDYENKGWAILFSGLLSGSLFYSGMAIDGNAPLIIYDKL